MPAIQTFGAFRNATWAPSLAYDYPGSPLPLTGANIAMQVRLYPGAADPALLSIAAIPFTDVPLSGTAGGAEEVRRLSLAPSLTVAQLGTLPTGGEAGSASEFAFDIRITYADGVSEILSTGKFVVYPGVTTI